MYNEVQLLQVNCFTKRNMLQVTLALSAAILMNFLRYMDLLQRECFVKHKGLASAAKLCMLSEFCVEIRYYHDFWKSL